MKLVALRAAIDRGLADLDAGRGVETTPKDLLAEAFDELGLEPVTVKSNAPSRPGSCPAART